MTTKILLHSDEFTLIKIGTTSKLIRIHTAWKNGHVVMFKSLWLPLGQIMSQEKKWIDREKGEFYVIYELPDWYVDRNNLGQYAYRSAKNFDIHIHNIKKELIWKYE